MSDLTMLYQEVIIDHSRRPRNFCDCESATHHADGYNPLCGDKLSLFLTIKNNVIENACFKGEGCAISTASASLMTEILKGKTIDEAKHLFKQFHQLVTENDHNKNDLENLGKLIILAGVREFPMRVKCATLAWHTLQAALNNTILASTE